MPTPEWNRVWVADLEETKDRPIEYYGAHWGDPNPALVFPRLVRGLLPESFMAWLLTNNRLRKALNARRSDQTRFHPGLYRVLTRYLRPFITPDTAVLEIGSGGGRWTNYMLAARHLTLVELNAEFFDILRRRFADHLAKIRFYQTRDYELEGVDSDSIDFVFSFGVFVHIDPEGIQAYLRELARVVRSGGHIVLQYADKTKEAAQKNPGFSDMTPSKMQGFIGELPQLEIVDQDLTALRHSALILLRKRGAG